MKRTPAQIKRLQTRFKSMRVADEVKLTEMELLIRAVEKRIIATKHEPELQQCYLRVKAGLVANQLLMEV